MALNLVQPLKESYSSRATDYIEAVAVQLGKYTSKVDALEEEKENLKARLKEIDIEIEKYSSLRHALNRVVRRFARFAARRKDEFILGNVKTIKTSAGTFGWRLNSRDTLIYEPGMEHRVAMELVKNERLDLLDMRLRKDAIKEALQNGQLRNFKSAAVERGETFVISPNGLRRISLCQDGTIKLGGER